MTNLTLAVEDDVLRRARMRALEQGTSVNALVRAYLERLAAGTQPDGAAAGFLARAEQVAGGSGPTGRTWTREDLHRH